MSAPLGRVVATERKPNTAFEFHFWTALDAPVGIGTIVRVDAAVEVGGVRPVVYGVVTEGFAYTDLQTPLHDVLGHDGSPASAGYAATARADVFTSDGNLEIEYDALNSITPGGLSVDGTVRFERGPDGYYKKVSDDRDPYPRIVTGQYRPGEPPRILDETDDEPVLPGALPGPVRDVVEGTGKVVDKACDIPWWVPVGPFSPLSPGGPIGRQILC